MHWNTEIAIAFNIYCMLGFFVMATKKRKIVTATIPLTPQDVKMVENLKVRLRIFKTTDLIRYALRNCSRQPSDPRSGE